MATRDYHLNTYQACARRTLRSTADGQESTSRLVVALGLGGEAGEAMEIIKKHYRDGRPMDIEHLKEELGDALWQIAVCAAQWGLSLNDVAHANLVKLDKRYGSR